MGSSRPSPCLLVSGQLGLVRDVMTAAGELAVAINAAHDTDIDGVVASAHDGFGPIQAAMDGFVHYCWMHAEGGGVSFNIWETAEHLAAANYAAANPVITSESETIVRNGVIGFSELLS
jgi:hypothetical protein